MIRVSPSQPVFVYLLLLEAETRHSLLMKKSGRAALVRRKMISAQRRRRAGFVWWDRGGVGHHNFSQLELDRYVGG